MLVVVVIVILIVVVVVMARTGDIVVEIARVFNHSLHA